MGLLDVLQIAVGWKHLVLNCDSFGYDCLDNSDNSLSRMETDKDAGIHYVSTLFSILFAFYFLIILFLFYFLFFFVFFNVLFYLLIHFSFFC